MIRPFHLAIPVREIVETRAFYRDTMGCREGRSSDRWVDMDLYGHQLVLHVSENLAHTEETNPVDGHDVPVPHFGVVLTPDDWQALADRLRSAGVAFLIEPHTRFKGEIGEQSTLFFLDPSGNALEFKAFQNDDQLFAK